MPRITLNTFNGLAPNFYGGSGGTLLKGVPYANDMGGVNPFIDPGYLQPGYNTTVIQSGGDLSTNIRSMATAHTDSAARLYGAGETKIYKFKGVPDGTANFTTFDTAWTHTISDALEGTAYTQDLIVSWMTLSAARKLCLFYSYNDADSQGTAKLARYNITDNTWADTAYELSTNTTPDPGNSNQTNCDRTMIKAPNGMIYIAGGSVVDGLDTTVEAGTDTMQKAILDIDTDYRIKSFGWYSNRLVICAQKAGATATLRGGIRIYMWDTYSPSWNEAYDIQDSQVGATYWDNDELFIFTTDSVRGKIRKFNGQEFPEIQEIPAAIPPPSSVDNFRDGFVFAAGDGVDSRNEIFAYFSRTPSEQRQLWQIMTVTGTVHCVKRITISNSRLHISGEVGGTDYLRYSDTSNYNTGFYNWPIIELPHRSNITRVAVYHPALASGAAVNVNLATNYSNSYSDYLTSSFANDGAVTRKVVTKQIPDVDALAVQLEWEAESGANTAKVARVEIDYELNPNASAS